jgi:hypothetical protein
MTKKANFRYPLVIVEWDDAEGDAGWTDPPDELKPVRCIQVGFLIKQTDRLLLLASCYIDNPEDKQISSTDKIPMSMVHSIKPFTPRFKHGKSLLTKTNKAASGVAGGPAVPATKSSEPA